MDGPDHVHVGLERKCGCTPESETDLGDPPADRQQRILGDHIDAVQVGPYPGLRPNPQNPQRFLQMFVT